jgi:hypothetical protein
MQKADKVIIAVTSAIVVFVTLFVLRNQFVWDDVYIIAQYDRLGESSSLGTAFTETYWDNTAYRDEQLTNLYRPLASFSLALIGIAFGPWEPSYHAFSLAALFAAAFALYSLLIRVITLENRRVVAVAISAVFVIHPLSCEVLCMASNAADHLALCFLLFSIARMFDHLGDPAPKKYRLLIASIFGFLSIASKEFGVIFLLAPLIAFALHKSLSPNFISKTLLSPSLWIYTVLPVLLYMAARILVIHHGGMGAYFSNESREWSVVTVALGVGVAFLKCIAPVPSGATLYAPAFSASAWAAAAAYAGIVAALIIFNYKKNKMILSIPLVGMILAALLLLPSLLIIAKSAIGYRFPTRYFHLSLAGFLIALAPFAAALWNKGFRIVIPVISILFALLSWMRIDEWQNEVTFSIAEAYYHPDSAMELHNLCSVYFNAKMYDKAEETILAMEKTEDAKNPECEALIFFLKAKLVIYRDKDFREGTALLEKALTLNPENLSFVYYLAETRADDRRPDQSMIILNTALNAPWFNAGQKADIKRQLADMRKKYGSSLHR